MSCLLIAQLRMKTSTSRELPWPGGQEIFLHEPVSSLLNLLHLTSSEETLTGPDCSWDLGRWDQVFPVPNYFCDRGCDTWLKCAAGHWKLWSKWAEDHEMLWYFHSGSQRKKLYCKSALEMQIIRAITVGQKEGPSVQDPYFQESICAVNFHLQLTPCDEQLPWPDVPPRASKTSKVPFSLPQRGEPGVTRTEFLSWKE